MTVAAQRQALPARRRASGAVLLATVATLAVVGAGTSVRAVLESRSAASATVTDGATARTRWGSVQVHPSEVVAGLSGRELGGMSHGVQNLVSAGQAQVAVSVTLHNTSDHVVRYRADQFRLRVGRAAPSGAPIAPLGTSLNSGSLRGGGTVEGTVSFVTAADGSQLWLQLDDGGRAVLVPIGRATASTTPDEAGHDH